MNIKQQLNNSFFALFIGALLIGARDANNFIHFDIPRILFFLFLIFFRLKLYLDDNYNYSDANLVMSSQRKDFVFGYITTIISWIIFPISAYRVWDGTIEVSIIFLGVAIFFTTLWTLSAAFMIKPIQAEHKKWFWFNIIYLILLAFLCSEIIFSKNAYFCDSCWITTILSYIIPIELILLLCCDYYKSETFKHV